MPAWVSAGYDEYAKRWVYTEITTSSPYYICAAVSTSDDATDSWNRYAFNMGNTLPDYQKLGAHPMTREGAAGTYFAVWAPSAEYVSVLGDFNDWHTGHHPLRPRESSGIWEGFAPDVHKGAIYKYAIEVKDIDYHGA